MKTLVNFILDKSGSMSICQDKTIKGFNEYLITLQNKFKKSKKDKMLFTLTMFDTEIVIPYVARDILKVPKLNEETYMPSGMTALYDAAVETIEKVSKKVDRTDEKMAILTVIMTDGEENSSQKHDNNCLSDLIKKLEKEGNWTFAFLGANQDSWATSNRMGIAVGNTIDFNTDDMVGNFNQLAEVTTSYALSMSSNADQNTALNTKNLFEGKRRLK